MAIPFSYSLRNLWMRRLTTILTVSGMAMVVFVFAAVLMLVEGFEKTLVSTGSYDNIMVIRKGTGSEVQSYVYKNDANIIESFPEIATGTDGRKFLAREAVILFNLTKRQSGKPANVIFRGITDESLKIRPQVKITSGRPPRFGTTEIMIGSNLANGFEGCDVDGELRFSKHRWKIVGIFDAGNTGFGSEIWGDVYQVLPAFSRTIFSSLTFKLQDGETFAAVRDRIETDPRMTVTAKREVDYYQEQSESTAKFMRVLGLTITMIFSLGAIIGAMITMYAAVSTRTSEIGTLRALGFQRRNILIAYLMEALLLGFIGGCVGLFLASFLKDLTVTNMLSMQTFSELAFKFTLSPAIAFKSMLFAITMGFLGGVLPASRAARMKIVDALRTN